MEQYFYINPKKIIINGQLKFDNIKLIVDTLDPSFVSFNRISVQVSSWNFYKLKILSNLAKIVYIEFEDENYGNKVEEFEPNESSVTEVLIVHKIIKSYWILKLLKIFKNVKSLDFRGLYYYKELN